jgi:eukaryotic-like serine/threonine-protein kinase
MKMVGERIGKIRIDGLLAQGGMGEVYAAFDELLGRRVAVKVIRSGQRIEPRHRARLLREAQALSQIEHPNLCQIHDYIEGDDADLIVLELIEGRTLRKAVADGLEFREKLKIAESVASVLVAAHRRGIVHRDLKPDNVMITPSGEVKVLDFGLARFIGATSQPVRPQPSGQSADEISEDDETAELPAVGAPPSPGSASDGTETVSAVVAPAVDEISPWVSPAASDDATMKGAAVGTPRYMSPEQARGEPATTASDMFSFGRLLVHLFTGQEPYAGIEDGQILMTKTAAGHRLTVRGIDSDVASLIDALQQGARSDRPTAAEALARIRSILERPKRRARIGLIAAAITMVVLAAGKYTLDLRAERSIALAAQEEARQRRADAEELIGFMLGDLREKLAPLGKLDILDAAGVKALEYYESLDSESLTPEELGRNAKALYQLGEVRTSQGKLTEAAAAFDQSLALARRAAERDPDDGSLQVELGAAEFYAGNAWRLQGDLAKAREHFRNYLGIAERLVAKDPENTAYRTEHGYALSNLGVLDEAEGAFGVALEHYRLNLEIKTRQLDENPEDFGLRAELTSALNKIGVVQWKLGHTSAAIETLGREIAIHRELLGEQPEHMRQKQSLATALDYLGSAQMFGGDFAAARATLNEVLQIRGELAARDSSNIHWMRNAAIPYFWLGDIERAEGRPSRALEEYAKARAALVRVVNADPARTAWKRDLGQLGINEAAALLDAGRGRDALARIDEAVAVLSPLAESDGVSRMQLGRAGLVRGAVLASIGRHADATAEWEESLRLFADSTGSQEARLRDLEAQTLLRLGREAEARALLATLDETRYASVDLRLLRAKLNP